MHAFLELKKLQKNTSSPAFGSLFELGRSMAMQHALTILFFIASEYDCHKDLYLYN